MSSSSSSSSTATTFVTTAVSIAAVTVVSLSLLQTDRASRLFLGPKQLQAKRVKEYLYKWDWTLTKYVLRFSRKGHDQQMDKASTELVWKEADLETFIQETLLKEPLAENNLTIMSIEVDDDDGEYYIYFRSPQTKEIYQLPLTKFGLVLAEAMENQLTSTTLCFVADASSGLGTRLLSTVLTESKAGVVRCC